MRATICSTLAVLLLACGSSSTTPSPDGPPTADAPPPTPDASNTVSLSPTGDPATTQSMVQAALINAKSGQTIMFTAGTYHFTDQLSLSVDGVTLKGVSKDDVVLDFSGQTTGGNGILVTAGNFIIDGFSIRDTAGDAVRVQGADPQHLAQNITFRNVVVYWSAGSQAANPGYALYPTTAQNVLIENCETHNASDACIYVGQSKNIMVRNNKVSECENGIEIENSTGAEVTGNTVMDNVSGILVFNLPNLPVKTGAQTVVHDNTVTGNNHVAFAPSNGGIGGLVPSGTGLVAFGANQTEFRGNTVSNNGGAAVLILSCPTVAIASQNASYCNDAGYNGYPKGTYVHGNTFTANGLTPGGIIYPLFQDASMHIETVLWDGGVDPAEADPTNDKLCIQETDATFVQASITNALGLTEGPARVSTDITPYNCSHPAVPGVTVNWGVE